MRCWGGRNEGVVGRRLIKVRVGQDADYTEKRGLVEAGDAGVYDCADDDERTAWAITDSDGRFVFDGVFTSPELAIAEVFKRVQPLTFLSLW